MWDLGDPGDDVCQTYKKCLQIIEGGRLDEVEQMIEALREQEPRYARELEQRLEVARRWAQARTSPEAIRAFWKWMDER